ncbi:MAG: GTPase ObgE [Clostridia bacterium]|nr:GTPase ObgE [Clostridia bacterium]
MFIDKAKVYVRGGDGGNGAVAFRREKFISKGGPSGGNGGRGGNVILRADEGLRTLVDFKYRRHYYGERGRHGEGKDRHGRDGEDLIVRVPVGTVIKDAKTGEVLGDLVFDGQEMVVARGGRGGRGNASFATSKNRAPTFAEKGEPGEEREIILELKLLADVGLVGMPNVGKSTIISKVSAAKPKIANYPFTTLVPNLGTVYLSEHESFVIADIPGLIEGAHKGSGLGHEFLRHVERTKLLVHVLDVSEIEGRDVVEDFEIINRELYAYSPVLAEKKQVVAANKMDLPGAEENLKKLKSHLKDKYEIFPISALTGESLKPLIYRLGQLLKEVESHTQREGADYPMGEPVVIRAEEEEKFRIEKENGIYVVTGKEVERHVARTDLNNEEAVRRLQLIFKKMGLEDALKEMGIKEGDTVKIGDVEFEYYDL